MSSKTYNITDPSIIIQYLSDKIYSQKGVSVVREYIANALDSHRVAKQSKKIDISINSARQYEPFSLKIRDYGVGLGEDDFFHYFAGYGASGKTATDSNIGKFGLGCKSAFALVTSFFVRSYHEGYLTEYHCQITTNSAEIKKLYSNPTSEENGLEVFIPNIPYQYSYEIFNTITNIVGFNNKLINYCYNEAKVECKPPVRVEDLTYCNEFGGFIDTNFGQAAGSSYVLVGGIPYQIQNNNFGFIIDKNSTILRMDAKDLDFTISREQFEDTPKTRKALADAWKKVWTPYRVAIDDAFSLVKDKDSALKFWSEHIDKKNAIYPITLLQKFLAPISKEIHFYINTNNLQSSLKHIENRCALLTKNKVITEKTKKAIELWISENTTVDENKKIIAPEYFVLTQRTTISDLSGQFIKGIVDLDEYKKKLPKSKRNSTKIEKSYAVRSHRFGTLDLRIKESELNNYFLVSNYDGLAIELARSNISDLFGLKKKIVFQAKSNSLEAKVNQDKQELTSFVRSVLENNVFDIRTTLPDTKKLVQEYTSAYNLLKSYFSKTGDKTREQSIRSINPNHMFSDDEALRTILATIGTIVSRTPRLNFVQKDDYSELKVAKSLILEIHELNKLYIPYNFKPPKFFQDHLVGLYDKWQELEIHAEKKE